MTYSFSYLEPVHCSISSSNYCFLICIQVSQEAGEMVWYSHILKEFSSLLWSTQRLFRIDSEADVFLKFSCFFYDPTDVGNLISGSSAFSKSSLNIWKFTVHVLLKPGLKNFEHYFTSVWDECNCAVVWAFFGIAFLWDWHGNWPLQSCGHYWVFQICWQLYCYLSHLHITQSKWSHSVVSDSLRSHGL